ncbi:MAG: gliding motility protein GldL, partial [Prevotella sp.]|nr:gliding motility protein GldL [Prevotella sp.]
AYSWGAAVVILGTLFKLTHLPGANVMLFIGMGTEVFVFFISAFDRPFDKSTIDMTLDNHMDDSIIDNAVEAPFDETDDDEPVSAPASAPYAASGIQGGTIIIGGVSNGNANVNANANGNANGFREAPEHQLDRKNQATAQEPISFEPAAAVAANAAETSAAASPAAVAAGGTVIGAPAPAVSVATAEAMETATTAYVERLEQLNETLQKVEQLSARLATDSEEMENLNRTLTGIARVYEMQLKSASQQITTQDSINEQTQLMADKIRELNSIYARMIEAMTTNMPKA